MGHRKKHFDAVEMSRKLHVATGRRLFAFAMSGQDEPLQFLAIRQRRQILDFIAIVDSKLL